MTRFARYIVWLVFNLLLTSCLGAPSEPLASQSANGLETTTGRPAAVSATSLASATPGQSGTPLSDASILYVRDCGLYSYPPVAALEKSEMRNWFGNDPLRCQESGRYLVGNSPEVSPTGKQLVVMSPTKTWLADLTVGSLETLQTRTISPTWSPGGTELAYVLDHVLYRLSVKPVGAPKALFSRPNLVAQLARWSPDGDWILTAALDATGSTGTGSQTITFWAVPTDGSAAIELGAAPMPAMDIAPDSIRWSPDSQSIATFTGWIFYLDGHKQHLDSFYDLEWWPAARAQRLIENPEATWFFSHDGNRLAVANPTESQTAISIIDAGTQQSIQAGTIIDARPLKVRWTPDDQALVLGVWHPDDQGIDSGRYEIWLVSISVPGNPELLLKQAQLVDVIRYPMVQD